MRRALLILAGLLTGLALLWLFAPREGMGPEGRFDASVLGDDPEIWLGVGEQRFADIRPGAAKRILWAGEKGRRTRLAIVYIHGFGASAEEIRPVPDEVARGLDANLFYTRLTGHGRAPAEMANVRAGEWLGDMAEAMAIGRRLGERVIVIGTSMGGALSLLAASDPALSAQMAGVVVLSPALSLHSPASVLMDAPFPRLWAGLLMGREQGIEPLNSDHARYWNTRWPTAALYPLGALMREARARDYSTVTLPLLVFYAPDDQVTDPAALTPLITAWGGSVQVEERRMQAGDDPYAHVIAGDTLSPGQTEAVTALILDWARDL